MNAKMLLSTLCLASSLALVGCGQQSEKDMLAEAQLCLDKASANNALSCVSKISHLNSPDAHALMCSAGFVESGVVSPSNLAKAFTALSDENAGATTMLASLRFENSSLMNTTNESCKKSGSAGFALISAMAKTATTLASFGSGINLGSCEAEGDCLEVIAEDIQTNIDAFVTDLEKALDPHNSDLTPEKEAKIIATAVDMAGSIVDIYEVSCGANVVSEDMCAEIDTALQNPGGTPIDIQAIISESDPAVREEKLTELAQSLLATWKSPTP